VFGQSWEKAEATIVARDAKFTGDGSVATYTYVADVRLSSGEMFRATIHEPTIATDFWAPSVRDVVSVLVKSKDRKVKFDKDDDRLSVKAYEAAKKKVFQDAQQQPAGTPLVARTSSTEIPDAVAAKLAQLGIGGGTPVPRSRRHLRPGSPSSRRCTTAGCSPPRSTPSSGTAYSTSSDAGRAGRLGRSAVEMSQIRPGSGPSLSRRGAQVDRGVLGLLVRHPVAVVNCGDSVTPPQL
jgi:hypothetical protein